jgi:hypothetical protein
MTVLWSPFGKDPFGQGSVGMAWPSRQGPRC